MLNCNVENSTKEDWWSTFESPLYLENHSYNQTFSCNVSYEWKEPLSATHDIFSGWGYMGNIWKNCSINCNWDQLRQNFTRHFLSVSPLCSYLSKQDWIVLCNELFFFLKIYFYGQICFLYSFLFNDCRNLRTSDFFLCISQKPWVEVWS